MKSNDLLPFEQGSSRLQEMLKRQIESTRDRTTNPTENIRNQQILNKQRYKSKYQQQIVEEIINDYKDKMYSKSNSSNQTEITNKDINLLFKTINPKLKLIKINELPDTQIWNQKEAVQVIYKTILMLCDQVQNKTRKSKATIEEIENQLINERNKQKDELKALESDIIKKKQKLQKIQTQINEIELKSKEDKKQFILKKKPKEQLIQRLEKRKMLMENVKK